MRKFLLPAATPPPRYLYCPFSFHAISPGNLSVRFLATSFHRVSLYYLCFSSFFLFSPPLLPSLSSFCFESISSRSNPRSFRNFQPEKHPFSFVASFIGGGGGTIDGESLIQMFCNLEHLNPSNDRKNSTSFLLDRL